MVTEDFLAVSRGDKEADLLLSGAKVIDVFDGRIREVDVAVFNGRIAGIGKYDARERVDLKGA